MKKITIFFIFFLFFFLFITPVNADQTSALNITILDENDNPCETIPISEQEWGNTSNLNQMLDNEGNLIYYYVEQNNDSYRIYLIYNENNYITNSSTELITSSQITPNDLYTSYTDNIFNEITKKTQLDIYQTANIQSLITLIILCSLIAIYFFIDIYLHNGFLH